MTITLKNAHEIYEHSGNSSPIHAGTFATLNLLRLYRADGTPVYFVVEGSSDINAENALDRTFLYNEHTCPTNYVQTAAIMTPDDDDPHGVFEYIRSVWMPKGFRDLDDDKENKIRQLFPETRNLKSAAPENKGGK